jgi:hypothetical protein
MNSLKSIVPFLLTSKTSKTYSANSAGSPNGKNCLYIRENSALSSWPAGQSLTKPLYLVRARARRVRRDRRKKGEGTHHCCSSRLSTVWAGAERA